MAEAFNIHFSTIADNLRNLLPDVLFDTAKLNNFVRSQKDESVIFSIPSITERDVVGYLLKIDSNKSTGIDDISSGMLKLAAPFIAPSIAKLINLSFSLKVFPTRWKTAKVTPIFISRAETLLTLQTIVRFPFCLYCRRLLKTCSQRTLQLSVWNWFNLH